MIRYETTDDQLRFVHVSLQEMLLAHPRVVDEEPRVRFSAFGDFALQEVVRARLDTTGLNEFRAIRENLLLRMMKIVKDAGTGFVFSSRTVCHTRDAGLDS